MEQAPLFIAKLIFSLFICMQGTNAFRNHGHRAPKPLDDPADFDLYDGESNHPILASHLDKNPDEEFNSQLLSKNSANLHSTTNPIDSQTNQELPRTDEAQKPTLISTTSPPSDTDHEGDRGSITKEQPATAQVAPVTEDWTVDEESEITPTKEASRQEAAEEKTSNEEPFSKDPPEEEEALKGEAPDKVSPQEEVPQAAAQSNEALPREDPRGAARSEQDPPAESPREKAPPAEALREKAPPVEVVIEEAPKERVEVGDAPKELNLSEEASKNDLASPPSSTPNTSAEAPKLAETETGSSPVSEGSDDYRKSLVFETQRGNQRRGPPSRPTPGRSSDKYPSIESEEVIEEDSASFDITLLFTPKIFISTVSVIMISVLIRMLTSNQEKPIATDLPRPEIRGGRSQEVDEIQRATLMNEIRLAEHQNKQLKTLFEKAPLMKALISLEEENLDESIKQKKSFLSACKQFEALSKANESLVSKFHMDRRTRFKLLKNMIDLRTISKKLHDLECGKAFAKKKDVIFEREVEVDFIEDQTDLHNSLLVEFEKTYKEYIDQIEQEKIRGERIELEKSRG